MKRLQEVKISGELVYKLLSELLFEMNAVTKELGPGGGIYCPRIYDIPLDADKHFHSLRVDIETGSLHVRFLADDEAVKDVFRPEGAPIPILNNTLDINTYNAYRREVHFKHLREEEYQRKQELLRESTPG